ncbi:transglutaminase [Roseivivax halodurans JCM 10272]|uniref:Transglutaminase n=1 Tax=Roseivivax halodurans JCM 10272 TaxID=1449350 RepID=X7EAZ0_9RHOB|nr:transglutaminase family protein [Roseivivax halodurans]ETX13254.1 transglutaminase [Roseivivax halodurans JCM 10272]
MKLRVRHVSRYVFDAPVKRLAQSHRLWPAETQGQSVIQWSVETENAVTGSGFRDGAGDWTQTVTVKGPVSEFTVTAEGLVETSDTSGVLRGHRERVPASAYLTGTRITGLTAELRMAAEAALEGMDAASPLDRAHALARYVSDHVVFAPNRTEPATTAAEALEGGEGVCQDHTHVLIALAHAADIPARYVTGYMLSTEDSQGAEASHAWAELHVHGLGWVGFDAANRCCPNEYYIRLGSGYDASDAAPIRGIVDGATQETLDVSVAVTDSARQSQSQRQQ